MAKETKHDRIVRGMIDQVTEHLCEMKLLESSTSAKESDVEHWTQGFLKNCLGYIPSMGYMIKSQETKGRHRPDLVVSKDEQPVIIIEVKRLGHNLNKSDFRSGKTQISEYLRAIGNIQWGILTNGLEWKLFDFSSGKGIEIAYFELKEDEQEFDTSKRAVESLCYEMVDFHETNFASDSWSDLSKEATVFLPETLAKSILAPQVIKHLAKSIRGEHDYKVNLELLMDKVHDLLEHGLDDSSSDWNEAKSIDFLKHLKSQKRSNRRARKAKARTHQPEHATEQLSNDKNDSAPKNNVA